MEEYTIYNAGNAKVVDEIPNAEWRVVKIYIRSDLYPLELHLCNIDKKSFVKQTGKFDCYDLQCKIPYGNHRDHRFNELFKCSSHCEDLPENRTLDVTAIIASGKIAGKLKLLSFSRTIVPAETQISNWERYVITNTEEPWLILYAKQNDRDYFKICPDVFPYSNGVPGYRNRQFESMFCGKKGLCSDLNTDTIIDVTNAIELTNK
jgi:hypothetical protein